MLAAWIGRSSCSSGARRSCSRSRSASSSIGAGQLDAIRDLTAEDADRRRRRGPSPPPPGTPHGQRVRARPAGPQRLVPRRPHGRRHPPARRRAAGRAGEPRGPPAPRPDARLDRRPLDDGGVRRRPRRGGRHGGPRHRRRLGRVPGPRAATARRSSCEPAARRSAGSWSSSRTCRSCAASSRSGPSSSTTSRTSCGRRFRRSASSPRRSPATPTAAGDGGAAQDARPDREDRGRDRPSRPDGQRAARPRPDRERRAARADRRHRHRPGGRRVRRAPPARSPSARACGSSSTSRTSLPRVRGDEARIGQVVVNLLHNAVKFSDRRRRGRRSGPGRTDGEVVVVGRGPRRSASRRPTRPGSSSGSTRSTGPASGAAARVSGCRSPGTSSSSTAAGSGSSPRKGSARRSRSRCPSRSAAETAH